MRIYITPEDRRRLEAVVRDHNRPQKHFWRARIILLNADGLGTNGIVRGGTMIHDYKRHSTTTL
jgi:hypothetical protein